MRPCIILISILLSLSQENLWAAAHAEHVVVVVWDGMRPDFIRPQYAPTLYDLASQGVFFRNHHSAYVSTTEVNGTVLATGMLPNHSGVMANTEYRPDMGWLAPFGTESLDAIRRGDMLSDGHYLEADTVPEILHKNGVATMIAGAKAVVLLHDRSGKKTTPAEKESVTLFRGQTLPRSTLDVLVKSRDVGPMPPSMGSSGGGTGRRARARAAGVSTNAAEMATPSAEPPTAPEPTSANSPDSWTTKALVHGLWRKGVPKYSLLWLSEPDSAQHETGVGSEAAIAAIESSDKQLASVLKALDEKGVRETTDVFVVSDHGFSTVQRGPEIIEALKAAKFTAGTQFQNPEAGDIMVLNLGGSVSFYVFDHNEEVIRRLVAFLQTCDFAGVIFCALPVEGTFTLAQAHLNPTNGAPDVVLSMRWSGENNEYGFPGLITSIEGRAGRGTHGSLSRFDLHNTLVAQGPDFKSGFVSDTPSGNIDLAPTVLAILGVPPPQPPHQQSMDGRVLAEAMTCDMPPQPQPSEQTLEASHDLGLLSWHQYLKLIHIGSAVYYDEGNGESRLRQANSASIPTDGLTR